MRNSLSEPQLFSHNCPEHGERLVAPISMTIECRCGRQCEPDIGAWVAEQVAQRPGENVEELAARAGIPAAKARTALRATEGV
jgi:hypothetical protein